MAEQQDTDKARDAKRLWELFKEMLRLVLEKRMGAPHNSSLGQLLAYPHGSQALASILHIDKSDTLAHRKQTLLDPKHSTPPIQRTWTYLTDSAEEIGLTAEPHYCHLSFKAARLARSLRKRGPDLSDLSSYDKVAKALLQGEGGNPATLILRLCSDHINVAATFLDQENAPWFVRQTILPVIRCCHGEIETCLAVVKRSQSYGFQQARSALDQVWSAITSFYVSLVDLCESSDVIAGLDLCALRPQKGAEGLWVTNDPRRTILERIGSSPAKQKLLHHPLPYKGHPRALAAFQRLIARVHGGIRVSRIDAMQGRALMKTLVDTINAPHDVARQTDVLAFAKGTCLLLDSNDFLLWVRYFGQPPAALLAPPH